MTPVPAPGPGRDADPARHAPGPGDPLQDEAAGWRRLPRWQVEQLASGNVQWTTPAGRRYTTEPTRYPI